MSDTPSPAPAGTPVGTPACGGPLAGLRVLDFGRYIAGPFCATLLADMGADVIRVERRDGSEDRYVQPIVPGAAPGEGGEGSMFLQMNRNKKSITLDPMHDAGREVVQRLVTTADVVVANLPPATLTRMGLDLDSLRAVREDVILTTVSGFGRGGPDSEKTGFDGVFQAMSGAAYLSGFGDAPVKSYAAWVDFGTAAFAALGTMAALMERGKSGKGQMVEGALLGTALTYFNFHLIEQQLRGTDREASGNRSQYAGPADSIRTKDGWIFVQVLGTPLFKRWARLMGEEHWLEDARFKDDLARGDHGEILSKRTAECFMLCFIDDAYGLKNLDELNEDLIAYECDYPHSDTLWPECPEHLWKTVQHLKEEQINKITHTNAMKWFNFDPFKHLKKEELTVGALRAAAKNAGVDTTPKSYGGERPLGEGEQTRRITSGDLMKMFSHHAQEGAKKAQTA